MLQNASDIDVMADENFSITTNNRCWNLRTLLLLSEPKPSPEAADQFGVHWIVAGHRIREQIADDRLLVRLLRHMLPAYSGDAITLFRGENLKRWEAGALGLAWTSNIEVAKMFGSGLNAVSCGGVLLEGSFEAGAIIAGPNAHSEYLGEYQFTIDPFYGAKVAIVQEFPPTT